jgi:hypothetical protein
MFVVLLRFTLSFVYKIYIVYWLDSCCSTVQ